MTPGVGVGAGAGLTPVRPAVKTTGSRHCARPVTRATSTGPADPVRMVRVVGAGSRVVSPVGLNRVVAAPPSAEPGAVSPVAVGPDVVSRDAVSPGRRPRGDDAVR